MVSSIMSEKPNNEANLDGNQDTKTSSTLNNNYSSSYKLKAGLFLLTASSIGFLGGFSGALAQSRKQDTQHFDKGLIGEKLTSKQGIDKFCSGINN